MKRNLTFMLLAVICLSLSACSPSAEPEQSSETESSVVSTQESEQSKAPTNELLQNSFGKLLVGKDYSISIKMTVVTFSDSSSDEDTSVDYTYDLIVNGSKSRAYLLMRQDKEIKGHYIIKDKKLYDLNDENAEYKISPYDNDVANFGKRFTTGIYLGISETLTVQENGTAAYTSTNKVKTDHLQYEKYTINSTNNQPMEQTTVTYYFKDKTPIAEVLETENGKTIFEFTQLSDKATDDTVYTIPDEYYEIV